MLDEAVKIMLEKLMSVAEQDIFKNNQLELIKVVMHRMRINYMFKDNEAVYHNAKSKTTVLTTVNKNPLTKEFITSMYLITNFIAGVGYV